jgi:hypothetical protein
MLYGRSVVFYRLLPYLSLDLFNFPLQLPISLLLLGQRPIRLDVIVRRPIYLVCIFPIVTLLHLKLFYFHSPNNPRGLFARLESGCAHARHILDTAYCNVSSLCRLSLLRTIDTPLATFTMWSLSNFYLLCVLSCTSVVYPLCLGRRCSSSGSHSLATRFGWLEASFKAMVQFGSLQRLLHSIPLYVVTISLHVMLE